MPDHRRGAYAALIGAGVTLCAPAAAFAQTDAGTTITNVAQASYAIDGNAASVSSNIAALRVAELLDIALTATSTTIPRTANAIPFSLVNRGNGAEAFRLHGLAARGRILGFAVDVDGDGRFDPARDTMLDDAVTARLAPRIAVKLLALVEIGEDDEFTLSADAITAHGSAGTLADGEDGVVAVVGNTTASASLRFTVQANSTQGGATEATLEKTQSVWSSDGSGMPMPRSIVTYTLTARFTRGTATDAVVADPIPAGTRYVPGSLTIDGNPLSDAADTDAGTFDGSAIRAALGNVTAPATRTIQFKVSIQ